VFLITALAWIINNAGRPLAGQTGHKKKRLFVIAVTSQCAFCDRRHIATATVALDVAAGGLKGDRQ
jgi:hypothetical protein